MSAFKSLRWKTGSPFSPSRIRAGRSLQGSDINAPTILEARPRPDASPVAMSLGHGAVAAAMSPSRQPGRQPGLCVAPIESFVWGSRSLPTCPRTRPDHVLIWVTEGHAQIDFPGDGVDLRAGTLHYVPAGTAFAAAAERGARGHVALIADALAAQAVPALPGVALAARVGSHAAQLDAALRGIAAESPDSEPGTWACLVNLLSLRLRQISAGHQPGSPDPAPPGRPLIDRFLALARLRLGAARTVAELAAELGSTTLLLDRACLGTHGKRAVELIHELRLEAAVRMLRGTTQPIQRIATDLGYSSHAHFTRAFVEATGRTPEAFRAQSG